MAKISRDYLELFTVSDDDLKINQTVAVLNTDSTELYDPIVKFIQHFSSWDHLKRDTLVS